MNYQVLARKWRPKKFEDVIGQQYVIQAITNSFDLKKIHHAYILSGSRGTGKTTIARLFAKGLSCEKDITSNMCGVCQNCKDIDLGNFSDLIEIDAASRTRVEETYEFLDHVQYSPSQGRFKIYLIDEVHMLSKHSFNALLKILEEPPKHVKFILVTTELQKIPETILSRCLQFYLKPLSVSQIVSKLQSILFEEKISASKIALKLLASSARGSMRDALNLSEQAILLGNNSITDNITRNMLGLLYIEEVLCLVEHLVDRDPNKIWTQINRYAELGINWDSFFEEILSIFQKTAIYQFSIHSSFKKKDENSVHNFEERILNLCNRITPEDIQLYYQIFLLGRRELPYAPSGRMGMEMTILRALAFKPTMNHTTNNDPSNNINDVSYDNKISQNSNCEKSLNNKNNNSHIINSTQDFANSTFISNETNINLTPKKLISDCNSLNNQSIQHNSIQNDHTISNDVVSKVLKAQQKLINYRKYYHQLNKNVINDNINDNTNEVFQKKSQEVLKRFININMHVKDDNLTNEKKK